MRFYDDEPANIDDKGRQLIENVKKAISTDKSNPDRERLIEEAMNAMYSHFATYREEDLNCFNLQIELFNVERMLSDEYIIESEPIFDENNEPVLPSNIDSEKDVTQLLDYIVYQTRKDLSKHSNLRVDSLEKQCFGTSYKLEDICAKIGVEAIHFGVDQELNHGMFHHFTMARIALKDGTYRNYLVDCTYRQFFTKSESNIRRIGVMRGPAKGASIGAYMTMTERRKEIAESLLSRGYVEATPEVIKEYFDAIVFSGRDKEYYDEHGLDYMNPDDIVPEYTAKDYIEMIIDRRLTKGKDMSAIANEIINDKALCPNPDELTNATIQDSTIDNEEIYDE